MHADPSSYLQLRNLTVRVENVLKGAPVPKTINVYYFTWDGAFIGARPLGFWDIGDRRILWLRRDLGVLRTSCDGRDSCTEGVYSGAHPNYLPDPQKPLDFALVDLHLTRGEGPVNEISFAHEVFREGAGTVPGLQSYSVGKLRKLVLAERGDVRSRACEALWIYTVDKVDAAIHQDAQDAMQAANCRCSTKAGGNIECR